MVREFLASVLGFLFTDEKVPPPVKGFLVFTVNVGSLPPFKAKAFCERCWSDINDKQDPGWQVVILPVRPPQETKFEAFAVDGHIDTEWVKIRRLEAYEALGESQEYQIKQDEDDDDQVGGTLLNTASITDGPILLGEGERDTLLNTASITDGPILLGEGERDLQNWREEIRMHLKGVLAAKST